MFSKTKKANLTKTAPKPPPLSMGLVFNCTTREFKELGASPVVFAAHSTADLVVPGLDAGRVCLRQELNQWRVVVESTNTDVYVNDRVVCNGEGETLSSSNVEHTLQIGDTNFYLIKIAPAGDLAVWKDQLKHTDWELHRWSSLAELRAYEVDNEKGPQPVTLGPMPFQEILQRLASRSVVGGAILVNLHGSKVAFRGHRLEGFLKSNISSASEGSLRCPRCFQRFEPGDMLAVHPTEHGDEWLGEEELKRFVPTRIGSDGRALDEQGRPCSIWACPHCRGALPQAYHEAPPDIISLVGDSFAGKSYFLTISIRQLKRTLFRDFGVNFADADAPENAVLNDMITKLFTARSAKEAALDKTRLAGDTYRRGMRFGKEEILPQPFSYRLAKDGRPATTAIVYDNAGEHFRPDVDERTKASATEHLAWSSGMIFLFDPVQHIDLLRKLKDSPDPQVEIARQAKFRCDQDVLLSEMGLRIRQWKNMAAGERLDTPFAFVVGKYDIWEKMLPRDKLDDRLHLGGRLNEEGIRQNSTVVRNFMMEFCPEVVNAAESISSNLCYFPVSAFGSPAVKTGDSIGGIAPDPEKMAPFLVETPWLWLVSQLEPALLNP